MNKKQRIIKKKAVRSDPLTQRMEETRKALRPAPVRPSQKHTNKRKCPKHRRRLGAAE